MALACWSQNATPRQWHCTVRSLHSDASMSHRAGHAVSTGAQVLKDEPPYAGIAHANLAVALWSLQDSAGALEAYRGATKADPTIGDAWLGLGSVLRMTGNLEAI